MTEIDITNATFTETGLLRLTFTLKFPEGKLILPGFRYNPDTDELLCPSFRGRRGGALKTVEAQGDLDNQLWMAARDLYFYYVR